MKPVAVIRLRANVAEAAALTCLTPAAGQDPVCAFEAALWACVLAGAR